MKVIILAGGLGTRLSELTHNIPKPMVEIGGLPMLWHIMQIYAHFGFVEFILALGYKSEVVKQYFLNFYARSNNLSIDLSSGETTIHDGNQPDWRVHLIDTGIHTQTGGRIKRLRKWIGSEPFLLTYGDGVADIDLHELIACHKKSGKLATVTAVHPPARFGGLVLEGSLVKEFTEKNQTKEGWINGGFFVLEPEVFDYIADEDKAIWEREPLEELAKDGELNAYFHNGFWQPMDTLREYRMLESLWDKGEAPWDFRKKAWI